MKNQGATQSFRKLVIMFPELGVDKLIEMLSKQHLVISRSTALVLIYEVKCVLKALEELKTAAQEQQVEVAVPTPVAEQPVVTASVPVDPKEARRLQKNAAARARRAAKKTPEQIEGFASRHI